MAHKRKTKAQLIDELDAREWELRALKAREEYLFQCHRELEDRYCELRERVNSLAEENQELRGTIEAYKISDQELCAKIREATEENKSLREHVLRDIEDFQSLKEDFVDVTRSLIATQRELDQTLEDLCSPVEDRSGDFDD